MISIIIPAHNNETLQKAVESILKQKYSHQEIIVIDDSVDNKIQENIQNINHSDIKYYKNTKNLGTTLSRKRGIQIAQGDYIGFLDDDDLADVFVAHQPDDKVLIHRADEFDNFNS